MPVVRILHEALHFIQDGLLCDTPLELVVFVMYSKWHIKLDLPEAMAISHRTVAIVASPQHIPASLAW